MKRYPMFPSNDEIESCWVMVGQPGQPLIQKASAGAALSRGMVLRDEKAGYVYWTDGRGRMSAEVAVSEGLMDAAAARLIAKQDGCYQENPLRVVSYTPAAPRPGTLAEFEGTPIGPLLAAMQTWRLSPTTDELFKVGKALQALMLAKG